MTSCPEFDGDVFLRFDFLCPANSIQVESPLPLVNRKCASDPKAFILQGVFPLLLGGRICWSSGYFLWRSCGLCVRLAGVSSFLAAQLGPHSISLFSLVFRDFFICCCYFVIALAVVGSVSSLKLTYPPPPCACCFSLTEFFFKTAFASLICDVVSRGHY